MLIFLGQTIDVPKQDKFLGAVGDGEHQGPGEFDYGIVSRVKGPLLGERSHSAQVWVSGEQDCSEKSSMGLVIGARGPFTGTD